MTSTSRRDFLTSCSGLALAPQARRPPNIIYVLCDDLGWSELGCYGNSFNRTPNLDRMAREGLRFTHAYSAAPVCSPTRAALITGQHPARTGITDYLRADDPLHLVPSPASLPAMLRTAGYATALIGKWHLMGDYTSRRGDPRLHGFESVICSETRYIGGGDYFHPYAHMPDVEARASDEYLTDRLNREAVNFVEANARRPFFLFLSHYAPHTRLAGQPEIAARYGKRPDAGKTRNNPELAAMLECIDDGIGRITAKLDTLGLARDTLLLFHSDNGGELNVTTNAPLRGGKSQLYEGGIRVPFLARWPGRIPSGTVASLPAVTTDLYPTFLELAGSGPPKDRILDGISLASFLSRPSAPPRPRDILWHYPLPQPHFLGGRSASALRDARWKLIEFLDTGELELYDLSQDPSETTNLASAQPARLKEMAAKLSNCRRSLTSSPSTP